MADSYTVQAILTLKDNLSAGLKNAAGATASLGSRFKSAVGLGAAMQIGMKAVGAAMNAVSAHIGDAVSRYDQLNQFPKVMSNLGVSAKDSSAALKTLDKGISGLPTTLDSATRGVTRFTSKNGDIKKSTQYFLAMNNAIVAGGQSTEIQGAAVEQLSQAYAKGKMDMVEWRSICTAMPAQMNMVAKAMNMSTDELGEGLRNGTVSMDEFMDTMVRLNKEGIDGFASFEKQALTSVGGIRTAFTRMNLAVTRGLEKCIGAVDQMLKNNGFEDGIAGLFTKAISTIDKAFQTVAKVIKKINLKGIIAGLAPAFETLKMAAVGAGKAIKPIAKWANDNAEGLASLIPLAIAGAGAFKAYKKISKWFAPLAGATKTMDTFGGSTKKAGKATLTLKKGLASLAKMAGVALVIASLALLAKSLEGIASCGGSAVAPLLGFAAAVSVMAVVLAETGKKLQAGIGGILAFGGAVAVMALAMAPIANAGEAASRNMATFGIVVAGLVAVFGLFGGALQGVMVPMLVLGATILLIGIALNQAAPFITAFSSLVKQLGDTISQVAGVMAAAISQIVTVIGGTLCNVMRTAGDVVSQVADSFSKGFQKICDGVSVVVDAISGGLASVLDSIAGIIESVGTSARNAGKGFVSVAEGIRMVSGLSIWDIGKSLGAVAVGMGEISSSGKNLPQVAAGMQGIVSAVALGAGSLAIFNASLAAMLGMITGVVTNVNGLKAAFSNFVITPPNTGPFVAAFAVIIASAQQMIPALRAAGIQAGAGLASGLSSGAGRARNAIRAAAASIIAALSILPPRFSAVGKAAGNVFASGLQGGMAKAAAATKQNVAQINASIKSAQNGAYAAGYNIGAGLANGMRAQLGNVRSVAAQLAAAAEAAIRAKAKIHSPSKVSTKLGAFFAGGWINAIKGRIMDAKKTAEQLVYVPSLRQPQFAMPYGGHGGSLNDDYSYGGGGTYVIEVPVNIDGREVSRVTAPYMQSDLNRIQARERRKRGIR